MWVDKDTKEYLLKNDFDDTNLSSTKDYNTNYSYSQL